MKNPVDLAVVQGVLEVLVLSVIVEIVIESGVVDGIYVDMSVGVGKGSLEEQVMSPDISSMGRVKFL